MKQRTALAALLLGAAGLASAATPLPVPPSGDEVRFYTQPLVRARLRLPESLKDFTIATVQPLADDPHRFAVTVQFEAKTPFGAYTPHTARFYMRHGSRAGVWIVTAAE